MIRFLRGPGWMDGEKVPGYRQEPGLSPDSFTETYAAVRLYLDNWRWQGGLWAAAQSNDLLDYAAVRRATDAKDGPGAIEAEILATAGEPLQVLRAQLHGDAGVVGAAAFAMRKQEVRT